MNISPKLSHILSAIISIIFVIYFFYEGFLAYIILKELGGGVDALVASRWGLATAMFVFACFTVPASLKWFLSLFESLF